MAFGDADRDVFLADFGVTVVYGATTTKGILDVATEETLPGISSVQQGNSKAVLVKAGVITPALGGAITVDGASYSVRKVEDVAPDGGFIRIWLAG